MDYNSEHPRKRTLMSTRQKRLRVLTEHRSDGTHFIEDWIAPSLENSWVNFGGGYAEAGYCKDRDGVVHLKGFIKDGDTGLKAFTLPVGYRPADRRLFFRVSSAGVLKVATIDIVAGNGSVIPNIPVINSWINLDGITFRVI